MNIRNYILHIAVFICGAVVLVLEIDGSRVLAPFMGTSLVVWASLIGVLLASLSAGYYIGGIRADKKGSLRDLSAIICTAGIFIGLTAFFKTMFLSFLTLYIYDIRFDAIFSAVVLFAPASILLGMVSPYAARLTMRDLAVSGRNIGMISALSTLGSIAGAFFSGFFLIAFFGNTNILFALSLILFVLSALLFWGKFPWDKAAFCLLALFCMGRIVFAAEANKADGFADVDTNYQRVQIGTGTSPDGREIRALRTDSFGTESAAFVGSDELYLDYTKMFDLVRFFVPRVPVRPSNALMIGGGAYSYPKAYLSEFPQAAMDVVEIDPKITGLAREFFGLKDDPRMRIFSEDGREFINQAAAKKPAQPYDAIFIDAFRSLTPPYELTTREAVEKMRDTLAPDGAALVNIVSGIEGDKGRFLRAEYATYAAVFPQVALFREFDRLNDPAGSAQNILKSAAPVSWKSSDSEIQTYLSGRITSPIPADVPVLTDDYAPVDQYLIGLYR